LENMIKITRITWRVTIMVATSSWCPTASRATSTCWDRRLAGTGGCAATLSVPVSGHRRMFPPSSKVENSSEEVISDGLISYIPFSDAVDDGSLPMEQEERARRHEANFRSLSSVVTRLAAAGRPVTCMVCTLSMPVVVEVAREHRLPFANYWI